MSQSTFPYHLYRQVQQSPLKKNTELRAPSPAESPRPGSPHHSQQGYISRSSTAIGLPSSGYGGGGRMQYVQGSGGDLHGNNRKGQNSGPLYSYGEEQIVTSFASMSSSANSPHVQAQLQKASLSRNMGAPHQRARSAAQKARGDIAGVIGPLSVEASANLNNNMNGLHRKDENSENQDYIVDDIVVDRDQWSKLDLGGTLLLVLGAKVCKYTFLTQLFINHNKLTALPPEIGELLQLVVLDASSNQLTFLPPEIGRLTSLRQLLLFDNQLVHMPSELGTLYQLDFIGLEGNPVAEPCKSLLLNDGTRPMIEYLRDNAAVPEPPPDRKWLEVTEESKESNGTGGEKISVLCYNILSETYASKTLFGYTPSWALAWDYRKELIMQEIMGYNADIVCLQEVLVDMFEDLFCPALSKENYRGIFYPKTRTRTMNEQQKRRTDGCAIFYKSSKFSLLDQQMIDLQHLALKRDDFRATEDVFNRVMNRDNIATACLLKIKSNGAKLMVVCAHVHWDPAFSDVKLVQVGMMMEELAILSTKWAKLESATKQVVEFKSVVDDTNDVGDDDNQPPQLYPNGSSIPLLICGDFNSTRTSGVGAYLSQGHIEGNHEDFLSHVYGRYTKEGMSHSFQLASAYETARNDDQNVLDFTNLTPGFTDIIDYIWYSQSSLQVSGVLGKVDENYLKQVVGFPNAHFPSDHLPILAELRFKQRKERVNNNTLQFP